MYARPAYLTRARRHPRPRKQSVMTNFKRRGTAALAVVLLVAPVTGAQTPARDTARFFGTWRLVSDTTTGMMIYDSLGNTNKIVWERAR
jgi:hypothetical protein